MGTPRDVAGVPIEDRGRFQYSLSYRGGYKAIPHAAAAQKCFGRKVRMRLQLG